MGPASPVGGYAGCGKIHSWINPMVPSTENKIFPHQEADVFIRDQMETFRRIGGPECFLQMSAAGRVHSNHLGVHRLKPSARCNRFVLSLSLNLSPLMKILQSACHGFHSEESGKGREELTHSLMAIVRQEKDGWSVRYKSIIERQVICMLNRCLQGRHCSCKL